MATLGYFVLLSTFVVCSYAVAASVAGARRGSKRLVDSGIGAFHLVTALMVMASVLMVQAFVTDDFSIRYVWKYSDSVQPLFFKITSYWGGLDGSIMFWVFLLACFGSVAVQVNRDSHRELIPYVVAVIAGVQMFFLFLMLIHNNPFDTFLTAVPPDGKGLNPLLQNVYMVIHPPSLYIGLVGMTIPFAFGMAALITGHLDDAWLRAVRRWTMFAWIFLSFGLTLGMIWAYEELGWGGFWGWDPVENAGLLPWFTATAFFHSVMVQERRSMLRVWNVTLVILTFFLTIFATFMTRSGIVQSVHSFGENPELAMMFSVFMIVVLVFSFGLVIYRLPLLRASNELDSWASREAAFLVNNWILLFCAFFVLFATMFPTISEALTGERLTVGPPFFNRWMLPIGLMLLLLTGIGPLLAWRKSSVENLRYQFLWPTVCGATTAVLVLALGVRVWSSGICFAFSAFVLGTISQEFWRGAVIRRKSTGTDLFTAAIGLVGRSRRRYGGYIVHVGIVLMFLGFAGQGFKKSEQVLLKPGQQTTVGDYTVRMDALRITQDDSKQMVTGHFTAFKNGKEIGKMYPARWLFHKHEEPTTEVAIRRMWDEDLYLVLPSYQVNTQSASVDIVVNPLINWIWVGFAVMAFGTTIVLLPERTFAFAMAKFPAEAATTAGMLLLMASLAGPAFAQHVETETNVPLAIYSPLERELHGDIICMCGTCGRKNLAECTCSKAADMRAEITGLVKEGKNHEDVIQYYVAKYGSQEPLASPIDKGFNRLAWLFPYAIGGFGAVAGAFVVRKWSRRSETSVPVLATAPASADDAALQARLDRELENLD
ncbi:MAG TPA: cytochrome c-type biogenesis CcmF C-terminal domain-containing protein [Vicinamibacterales bacterium]|nr:cytochrome c-type biogenesis CcmF C-terminal domain-containing protein [Vicinamibacterales bacterium]